MALVFTTTDKASAEHGVKFLIHGRAGFGKTRLCATAPSPLIISAESGLLSMAEYSIPTIVINTFADLDDAYKFVAYSDHAKDFATVCLDSLSEMAEQCLRNEKGLSKDPRKAYGEMQDKILDRVRWFRDLKGKHVYFSAKMAANKDEATGLTLYGPMMPGQKVGPALPYMFDEVFSLEKYKNQDGSEGNYLRTRPSIQYEAKDRSGKLDEYEMPDLTRIINKILNKQGVA